MDWSKLKASKDDKLNMTEKLKYVMGRVKKKKKLLKKEKMLVSSIFLFFQQCFQKASFWGLLKVMIVLYRVKTTKIYE